MTKIGESVGIDWKSAASSKVPVTLCSEERGKWDAGTVVGIKRSDRVLVLGNPAWFPWITDQVDFVQSWKKIALQDEKSFDKVVIGRETTFSKQLIEEATRFLVPRGLLVHFTHDAGTSWEFREVISFFHPTAQVWELECAFGNVSIAQLNGGSWRKS